MNSAQFVDQSQCYLCSSSRRTLELEMGLDEGELHLRWVRCSDCSLVYMDPRPSLHALTTLYDSNNYWRGNDGYKDYLAEERWRKKQACDRADWFVRHLGSSHLHSEANVLEVGSAAGYFLEALSELGVRPHGLDISSPMVRLAEARSKASIPVSQGSVEDSSFPESSFQGVVAWGCDSNFHDLLSSFQQFSKWLCPGGLLAFNFHDHDHWARKLRGRFKMTPNALYFLNERNVKDLLKTHGFEIASYQTETFWMNIASLYHHTGHLALKPLLKTGLARHPFRVPVPGSFRVLARRL